MPDSVQLLEEVYADLYTHIKWKRGCVGIHGGLGKGAELLTVPVVHLGGLYPHDPLRLPLEPASECCYMD